MDDTTLELTCGLSAKTWTPVGELAKIAGLPEALTGAALDVMVGNALAERTVVGKLRCYRLTSAGVDVADNAFTEGEVV